MSQSLAFRGDTGLLSASEPQFDETNLLDSTKNCRVICFNHTGTHFAWSDGQCVKILDLQQNTTVELDVQRTQFLEWSPKDNYLATWEVFAVREGKQDPNLRIWDMKGDLKASFVSRKSEGWAPRWSNTEEYVAVQTLNREVAYYKNQDFTTAEKKLSLAKMDSYSVSPNGNHVVAFVPGQKGAPGFAKMFCFPSFNPEKDVIAYKSFMLADRMEAQWSQNSQNVLLLMVSEVDKTGASYYGKSQLHFMDIQGETAMVSLAKEGPIYHVEWAPKMAQFCVVYGFMPAKATLYNKKCEKVFDFGTGPRNLALFNPQGSLLMLGGFGNLRGTIEIWDVEKQKEVAKFEASDATAVKWSPDGQHILTTTCAPRLRVNNGFKVWHYTSTLMYETFYKDADAKGPGEELWEAIWRPNSELGGKKFQILDKPISGGVKPKQALASKQAYVPPGARGKVGKDGVYKAKNPPIGNSKLHDEDELPENLKGKADEAENLSKSAAKNKKRREAAKKKQHEETNNPANPGDKANSAEKDSASATTGDPEKDKKIRKVNDKLSQIAKLKAQVKEGKQLEANQLEKIKKESELLAELKQLKI